MLAVFYLAEKMIHDGEILWLTDRIKAQSQTEAVGQGNFFFHGIAMMQFTLHHPGLGIVLHVLREKMSAVTGGIDAHVLRR